MTYIVSKFFDLVYSITHIFSVYVNQNDINSFYDNKLFVQDASGNDINLSKYQGKISLVVNVASKCGFTDGHYKGLVKLQEEMNKIGKGNRFNVLAFPCNQFGKQEPMCSTDVISKIGPKYSVNFEIFDKINVNVDNVPKAWQYLIAKTSRAPNWNFWKYIINADGKVVGSYNPFVSISEITDVIEKLVTEADDVDDVTEADDFDDVTEADDVDDVTEAADVDDIEESSPEVGRKSHDEM